MHYIFVRHGVKTHENLTRVFDMGSIKGIFMLYQDN